MGSKEPIQPDDPLRAALAEPAAATEPGPDCLDEGTIAALVDGVLPEPSRAVALAHVAGCPVCRVTVAEAVATLHDPAVTKEFPARRGLRTIARRVAPWAAAAAALVIVTIGVERIRTGSVPPAVRDETLTSAAAPMAISPQGSVTARPVFRWSKVSTADLYHLIVFNEEGAVVWETRTPDTTATLPAATTLDSGRTFAWRIEARTDFDRWVASPLTTFRANAGREKP